MSYGDTNKHNSDLRLNELFLISPNLKQIKTNRM